MKFAGNTSWILYSDEVRPGAPKIPIPRLTVSEGTLNFLFLFFFFEIYVQGTTPAGSQWARSPVPGCYFGQQAKCGDPKMPPCLTCETGTLNWGGKQIPYYGGKEWIDFVRCGVVMSGESPTQTWANNTAGPPGGVLCGPHTQFPAPLPGVSGFVTNATDPIDKLNIVDLVTVPDVPPGKYLVSFRLDCEQSPQIWQNCADIIIE
jgi:hypothetical protein